MLTIIIGIIFFLGFFANTLFYYNILPGYFAVFTEVLILMLFLYSFFLNVSRKRLYHFNYIIIFLFLGNCMISMTVNHAWSIDVIFSLRLILRFYLLYVAIANLKLPDEKMRQLNRVLFVCLALQLPVVAVKFYLYGISELTMGAYAVREGSLTTMIPAVIIVFLAAYYLEYRQNKLYLLFILGFIFFAIVGKKRAILFYLPLTFLLVYFLAIHKASRIQWFFKFHYLMAILGAVLAVGAVILVINPTLNPENKIGGSVDLGHALTYAKSYTTREDGEGATTGRFSSTMRVFEVLTRDGTYRLLFGLGPGRITPSLLAPEKKMEIDKLMRNNFRIKYGLTPMTWAIIEYGIVGAFIFWMLTVRYALLCRRYFKIEQMPYWKAFAIGAYGFSLFMIVFYITYHPPAFTGDTMPLLYFFTMAVVHTRYQRAVAASGSGGTPYVRKSKQEKLLWRTNQI